MNIYCIFVCIIFSQNLQKKTYVLKSNALAACVQSGLRCIRTGIGYLPYISQRYEQDGGCTAPTCIQCLAGINCKIYHLDDIDWHVPMNVWGNSFILTYFNVWRTLYWNVFILFMFSEHKELTLNIRVAIFFRLLLD
jgi:hypothetical protein